MRKFFTYALLVLIPYFANPKNLNELSFSFNEEEVNRIRLEESYIERLVEKQKEIVTLLRLEQLESSEFSVNTFIEYITLLDPVNGEIMAKQAILESGWFKSSLFTKYNNIFGMCTPRSRETLASGTAFTKKVFYSDTTDPRGCRTINYHYAKFNHWTESVRDYFLWRKYYEDKGHNIDNYYAFLNKVGYAYESNYVRVLKTINLQKQIDRLNGKLNC